MTRPLAPYAGRSALTAETLAKYQGLDARDLAREAQRAARHKVRRVVGKRTASVQCSCGWAHSVPRQHPNARAALDIAEGAHLSTIATTQRTQP